MKLTGQDIHQAFVVSYPYLEPSWDNLKPCSQEGYEKVVHELNKKLADDRITIQAVRCPTCNEMLEGEHAENHACWLKGDA